MRTLSVQGANDGGLSSDAKQSIQSEIDPAHQGAQPDLEPPPSSTANLLDGSYSSSFQVGANTSADDKISVTIGNMGAVALGVAGIDVTAAASNAKTAHDHDGRCGRHHRCDSLYDAATDFRTTPRSTMFQASTARSPSGRSAFDLTSVDYSQRTRLLPGASPPRTPPDAALGQGRPPSRPLPPASRSPATGTAATRRTSLPRMQPTFAQASGATEAINLIDSAITSVSNQRSSLGAIQNRFDHTINNLNVANENLTASESRIRDTDMASEMVQFTRSQILSQAGTAMLAQAKSLPQSVLQLLR